MKNNNNIQPSGNLEKYGLKITRYGLAVVLIWIGILKFASYEAAGIKPLVENNPLLSWLYAFFGIEGVSGLLGVIEILSGVLICLRQFLPKASAYGSIGAIVIFAITLTLLFSTPGIVQNGYSFPFISPMPGQFILKDIVLLGASIYTAGEAFDAVRMNKLSLSSGSIHRL
ncbi:DUF417 family protein [soil metagenome]